MKQIVNKSEYDEFLVSSVDFYNRVVMCKKCFKLFYSIVSVKTSFKTKRKKETYQKICDNCKYQHNIPT